MRIAGIASIVTALTIAVSGQWVKQTINTTASFRGLSVVSEKVIWASGTGGTVIRTINKGKSWDVITVPGAEMLDFRDIEAFDAKTSYILSIGNGDSSRIYKTIDGGKSWQLQFTNTNKNAFYDALACWDVNNCIAMSDPVRGRFLLRRTTDGGAYWSLIGTERMPAVSEGEAAFAASGTCLITKGRDSAFLVTGGNNARGFKSDDRGRNWAVYETPLVRGTPGSGIFSIAMLDDMNGIVVGGNYEKPNENINNLAFTSDGGKTWVASSGLSGYRSGVTYVDKKTIVAVGTNGSDITRDGGKTWKQLDKGDYNSVQAKGKRAVWAVGPKGMVAKMK